MSREIQINNAAVGGEPRWWQLLAAFLIDAAVYAAGFFAPFMFFLAMEWSNGGVYVPPEWKFWVKILLFVYILAFCFVFVPLYPALFHASPLRATIGKLLTGSYVADLNGEKLSFKQALFRALSGAQHAGSVTALQNARRESQVRSRFWKAS